jgi:uncharacterized membrane-anchored protein YitT (DUF2179 family)
LIIGYLYLGGLRFTVRTLVSVAIFSATVDAMGAAFPPLTHDAFLATLYGGVISGVGIGLVFGRGASTGGTTIVARLLQEFTHLSAGIAQLLVDAFVVTLSGIVFGPEVALYSLIVLFVSSKAIDWTLEGLSGERVALIISGRTEAISARIMQELDRGTTLLFARGGYTGEERPVLLSVVERAQEPQLRSLVASEDPGAFVVVTAATTVLGEGFTPLAAVRRRRKQAAQVAESTSQDGEVR